MPYECYEHQAITKGWRFFQQVSTFCIPKSGRVILSLHFCLSHSMFHRCLGTSHHLHITDILIHSHDRGKQSTYLSEENCIEERLVTLKTNSLGQLRYICHHISFPSLERLLTLPTQTLNSPVLPENYKLWINTFITQTQWVAKLSLVYSVTLAFTHKKICWQKDMKSTIKMIRNLTLLTGRKSGSSQGRQMESQLCSLQSSYYPVKLL